MVRLGNIAVTELDSDSTEIASVADDIDNSQVTCAPEEVKAALDKVITKAQFSLEEVKEKLEELTGTTALPPRH